MWSSPAAGERVRGTSGNHPAMTILLQPGSPVARAALAIVSGQRVVALPGGPDPDPVTDAADILAVLARHTRTATSYVQWWVPEAEALSPPWLHVGARLRTHGLCTYYDTHLLRIALQQRGATELSIEFKTDQPPDESVQVHAELAIIDAHDRPGLLQLGLPGIARQVLALTDETGPWPWLDRITRATRPRWTPASTELLLAGAS